jgi:acyl-coenzyme A thioesterase PaaI-like protein
MSGDPIAAVATHRRRTSQHAPAGVPRWQRQQHPVPPLRQHGRRHHRIDPTTEASPSPRVAVTSVTSTTGNPPRLHDRGIIGGGRRVGASRRQVPVRTYTDGVVSEPVRGGWPEPSFHARPGLERARAHLRRVVPRSPLSHLVGYRVTQVGLGVATVTMPASPWLQGLDDTIMVDVLLETAMTVAAMTGAPPGASVRLLSTSTSRFRPATCESGTLIARARTLHTRPHADLCGSGGRGLARPPGMPRHCRHCRAAGGHPACSSRRSG